MRSIALSLTAAALFASTAAMAQSSAGFSPAASFASFLRTAPASRLVAPGPDTARRVSFSPAGLAAQTWPLGAPRGNFAAPMQDVVASAFSPAALAALRGEAPAATVTVTVIAQR